jgi:hypothetical protein
LEHDVGLSAYIINLHVDKILQHLEINHFKEQGTIEPSVNREGLYFYFLVVDTPLCLMYNNKIKLCVYVYNTAIYLFY